MPANALNSSTLSEALTREQVEFSVNSTSNISVGDLLAITDSSLELVKVRGIPISGRVQVHRGANGTEARVHVSGAKFWIGSPEKFKSIKESAAAIVGVNVSNLPDYMLPGQRARDARGNEFIMIDATSQLYSGCLVNISVDGAFTASVARGGNAQGPVGLMVDEGTSDQWAWCQIYGYNAYAQWVGASAANSVNSTYLPFNTTVASTPSVGLDAASAITTASNYWIKGMFVVGVSSSAVTSAASATGIAFPVFLNYPYVSQYLDSIETSNS